MDNTHSIISDNVVTESITVEEYNMTLAVGEALKFPIKLKPIQRD